MRFFAAVLILAVHSFRPILDISALNIMADLGVVGVSFFFVLSGFVLTWSARVGDSPKAFYRRRWARVYPLHIVTTLIALSTLVFGPAFATWYTTIFAVLLLQAWAPTPSWYLAGNAPSWSLSCEAFFYATFPFTYRWLSKMQPGKLLRVAVAIVLYLAVTPAVFLLLTTPQFNHAITYINPLYRVGEFTLGIIIALAMRYPIPVLRVSQAAIFAVLSYICVAAVKVALILLLDWTLADAYAALLLMPAWIVLITSGARADTTGAPSLFRRRYLIVLGEWSFALYLVHAFARDTLLWLWPPPFTRPESVAVELIFVASSIALAGILHVAVERPLEKRLRGRRR
ncbi:hypothetical protein Kisp02_32130 [Kineosporia sp. NBRC 101731]|nr:hypothetical protein Kisp02_32130 [Kineosporia sp. NBRC 101731]